MNHSSKTTVDNSSVDQSANDPTLPWYKIPWFWIIMSPLITVFFACAITISIALNNTDDVVVGDYYKEGLLINDQKERQRQASSLGLHGEVVFDLELGEVFVVINNDMGALNKKSEGENENVLSDSPPNQLLLTLSHPAKHEKDFSIRLQPLVSQNSSLVKQKVQIQEKNTLTIRYFSELTESLNHKWYWSLSPLENLSQQWMIKGEVDFEKSNTVSF